VPGKDQYDVIIVGGSVGGCVLALSYARHNLRIALLEQKPDTSDYKKLCTHFIQPMALPVLRDLGLDGAMESAGAIPTKAAFWTPVGWIDPPGDYGGDASTAYAYNMERRLLDPLLRERIKGCSNIDLRMGHRVAALQPADDGEWVVEAVERDMRHSLRARLVVAADGRHSALAQLLGNPSEAAENHRSALFGYFEGIATPEHDRSLFILSEPERGFLYPLCAGRTLLALYVPKSSAEQWQSQRASLEADIKSYFQRFPGVPDISRSKLVSPVFGYQDYPNLARKAVFNGIAFIGDAALSLDPLSGVGCGFAIVSGKLLAEATICALLERSDQAPALAAYESQFNKVILPHARGIRADSLIAKSEELSSQTYRCIASSATLQKQFVDLTGRLIAPMAFQRAFASAMVKAHAVAR
jgi:flavin-dependent dehydrogenase